MTGTKRGGIERVAHDLADGLASRGHLVTVWSYDPRPHGARYEWRALPAGRLAHNWLGQRLMMGYLGNIITLLPRYRDVDVIISHGDSLLMPLLGKPVIRVMHGSALGEARHARSPFRMVLQAGVYVQELLTAATQRGVVGVSRNTRRYNPFVRRVVFNGADLTRFTPAPSAKTPQPSVLFVGAIGGRKRGARLLEWFTGDIRPQFPSATLTMVTESGPQIDGVTYRQGISEDEIAALYRQSWVYASPSSYEGFGLPYLEAMASGTPVVASPNAGSRELLGPSQYGLIVPDEEFAPALIRLLSDPALRTTMADRGLERSREYSLDTMIAAYERLMEEMCRTRPPRSRDDNGGE